MTEIHADLRIALLGNRGTGKSSAANTILDRDAFRVQFSARAVTQSCERRRREADGRTISVIDTPGLFDTSLTKEQLEAEMENLARMSDPGLHAFLLVIRLDVGLTDKEKNMLKWIQKYLEETLHATPSFCSLMLIS
ncbi:GTPase IMAP family member 9-like [Xyrauchen texanus]|uniref:GTPase IMAP family member 9-like n=1 Tax=Xyrauchen texanus TaxID=154827 RepID=UPI002241DA3D|nr:GTPase IMAP family member 9-like [Xyrauchen texanus]